MIKRFIQKPPAIFPWVALFHIAMLLFSIWNYRTEPFPSSGWLQPLWMLCYTIVWLFVCDMKRWAGLTYIGLTTLNLGLRFFLKDPMLLNDLTDTLFPIDVAFSFIILYYLKKMD